MRCVWYAYIDYYENAWANRRFSMSFCIYSLLFYSFSLLIFLFSSSLILCAWIAFWFYFIECTAGICCRFFRLQLFFSFSPILLLVHIYPSILHHLSLSINYCKLLFLLKVLKLLFLFVTGSIFSHYIRTFNF